MDITNKIDEVTELKLSKNEVKQYVKEILRKNNCRAITNEVDERVSDYVDPNWEDDGDYESEHEWYIDFGRGEAEDDVIEELVRSLERNKKVKFHIDSFIDIGKAVARKCNVDY